MDATAFLRSDALPGDAALGYVRVDGEWRSNVFHLPVRGTGDGGAFTTVDDVHRLWSALLGGRIVSEATVTDMLRARSEPDEDGEAYGLGVWLTPATGEVELHGFDAGASFISVHDPVRRSTCTVLANTVEGAWPVYRAIAEPPATSVGVAQADDPRQASTRSGGPPGASRTPPRPCRPTSWPASSSAHVHDGQAAQDTRWSRRRARR